MKRYARESTEPQEAVGGCTPSDKEAQTCLRDQREPHEHRDLNEDGLNDVRQHVRQDHAPQAFAHPNDVAASM